MGICIKILCNIPQKIFSSFSLFHSNDFKSSMGNLKRLELGAWMILARRDKIMEMHLINRAGILTRFPSEWSFA